MVEANSDKYQILRPCAVTLVVSIVTTVSGMISHLIMRFVPLVMFQFLLFQLRITEIMEYQFLKDAASHSPLFCSSAVGSRMNGI